MSVKAQLAPLTRSGEGVGYGLGLPIAVGLAALLAWEIGVRLAKVPPVLLPAPSDIAAAFLRIAGELAGHAMATGTEAVVSFLLAAVLGVAIASVLSASAIAFEAVYPHMILFQIIPKIALAPLFTFWLGIESTSRLAFAVFISFFPVALATMTGLTRTDAGSLRLSQALTASRWQTFLSIRVPYALPYIFSGLKIAASLSTCRSAAASARSRPPRRSGRASSTTASSSPPRSS